MSVVDFTIDEWNRAIAYQYAFADCLKDSWLQSAKKTIP